MSTEALLTGVKLGYESRCLPTGEKGNYTAVQVNEAGLHFRTRWSIGTRFTLFPEINNTHTTPSAPVKETIYIKPSFRWKSSNAEQ